MKKLIMITLLLLGSIAVMAQANRSAKYVQKHYPTAYLVFEHHAIDEWEKGNGSVQDYINRQTQAYFETVAFYEYQVGKHPNLEDELLTIYEESLSRWHIEGCESIFDSLSNMDKLLAETHVDWEMVIFDFKKSTRNLLY